MTSDKWTAIQLLLDIPPTGQPDDATADAVLAMLAPYRKPREDGLTARGLAELIGHEAIVLEAYRDSVNVWTWGIGVTNASGHLVNRYKDNPQTVARCLEIFLWLVEKTYLPAVKRAFGSKADALTEAQLHAALSFHYNTGAIARASWVKSWVIGNESKARVEFMQWRKPPEIIPRRQKERDLFFDGNWSGDGTALLVPVSKPSYTPNFRQARRVDVMADLERVL